MLDVILPLGVLTILLLGLRSCLKLIQNWILNRTIRQAMEKRPESLPMLLEKLESTSGSWGQDAIGWASIAAGLAIAAAALLELGSERMMMFQFALLPLFVGASLLLHHHFTRRSRA